MNISELFDAVWDKKITRDECRHVAKELDIEVRRRKDLLLIIDAKDIADSLAYMNKAIECYAEYLFEEVGSGPHFDIYLQAYLLLDKNMPAPQRNGRSLYPISSVVEARKEKVRAYITKSSDITRDDLLKEFYKYATWRIIETYSLPDSAVGILELVANGEKPPSYFREKLFAQRMEKLSGCFAVIFRLLGAVMMFTCLIAVGLGVMLLN